MRRQKLRCCNSESPSTVLKAAGLRTEGRSDTLVNDVEQYAEREENAA